MLQNKQIFECYNINYVMSSNAHTLKDKSNFKKGWMIMYLVKKNAKKYIANNLIRAHHTK